MNDVLIIDDSAPVLERLKNLLAEVPGVQVVGLAENADQAMDCFRNAAPDTVILDIRLPGKNGIELLQEIKKCRPETLVIMLTDYDFEHYRRRCAGLGADYFFNKTREFDKLVEVLAR
jgi:DNA-binding NarL/FixJ family response regulator